MFRLGRLFIPVDYKLYKCMHTHTYTHTLLLNPCFHRLVSQEFKCYLTQWRTARLFFSLPSSAVSLSYMRTVNEKWIINTSQDGARGASMTQASWLDVASVCISVSSPSVHFCLLLQPCKRRKLRKILILPNTIFQMTLCFHFCRNSLVTAWCGLACTEAWLQPHPTPLG